MSDNDIQAAPGSEKDASPAISPHRSLSVPRERLAGSPACLNCGTELKGPFCFYCGQPDRNFLRFFPVLLREMLSDFIDLDSRFVRTMKPLLFRPGRLTRDYLDGRRFRYTPPIRLYLFSSIVFFLVAALLSSNAVNVAIEEGAMNQSQLTEEQAARAREAIKDLPPEMKEQFDVDIEKAIENAARANQEGQESGQTNRWFNMDGLEVNDEPWDPVNNPVDLPWVPQWIDDWINKELEDSPAKSEEINRNPDIIIGKVFDILPATMFVLLPVVALLFKFCYLFARKYYIEHLIFALHNHAFVFVSLLLILLASVGMSWAGAHEQDQLREALRWFLIVVSSWIPLYLLISLRTVYRQNWFLTLIKFGVIGISYVSLLVGLTVIVAALSFLLL